MKTNAEVLCRALVCLLVWSGCQSKNSPPSEQAINELKLKRGELVACGPADKQFGSIYFATSCSPWVKKDFELGIALLHSFEYEEAEKVFARIIAKNASCPMAYWGVAMSNYHQVWPSPPSVEELTKGYKAISIAQMLPNVPTKERDYINAMAAFYNNWQTLDHATRTKRYASAMEQLYSRYNNDKEVGIFYALSLLASADPSDKSFSNQKRAGALLINLYPDQPDHPGVVHYIIHSYDYPALASLALPAARKYASIAPSSAHAQHMPSHIFTRLGLWDECIESNLASTSSARCYAQSAGIKGHWDEELHALDYLVYAYLQKGQNDSALQQLHYLRSIKEVYPANFKVAYAFAAIPARYYLENKMWKEAAGMSLYPMAFPWQKFPWQKSIYHFARLLGCAHTGNLPGARNELSILRQLHDTLVMQKDDYKANQVFIQIKSGEAWIALKEGQDSKALQLMLQAADMEDKTEKSPVTPGEILPARELLGDMQTELNNKAEALTAYQAVLITHPNRLNSLRGVKRISIMP